MMGWLGSTNKFGFERGTDFPKKVNLVNFGAVCSGAKKGATRGGDGFRERRPSGIVGPGPTWQ